MNCLFTVDGDGNVEGYYYDTEGKVPKYRLEKDCQRLNQGLLPKWVRTDTYEYKAPIWNRTNDIEDNNFQPVAEQLVDSGESLCIEGRAGTGKSTFIRTLHQ